MRFQFTLQTLLLSAVVIWSSLAVFGPAGLLVAAVILAAVAYIRSAESMWRAAGIVLLILLGGACLIGLLISPITVVRESARRAVCLSNMKQLALALHNYHDVYGCFPPAYIADSNGKPMHSWRVLILPYLEEQALYKAYDFTEPWDGPNNRKLAQNKPPVYGCPSSNNSAAASLATSYVAVVGPKTLWPGAKVTRLSDIRDGTDNTIMLVENTNSDINWMEPRDVSFEEAVRGNGFSSPHVRKNGYFYHGTPAFTVALAQGSVWSLPQELPTETLEALLTIHGGEAVDMEYCTNHAVPRRLNWTNCVAVVALVASVLLLLLRPRRRVPQGAESSCGAPGKPGR
jgi:hypothetical protein